ncbi:hypothetical protein AAAT70_18970, partial [Phocaeicola vulgatus]|uniref:hypothetical protein n=3 Tax=Phocaeicola vulgatus TaxID=821 RepID=UPI001C3897C8
LKPPDLKKFRRLFFVYARMKCGLYRFFPVGVGTFPTELSGRLRHVLSPAEAVPETLAGYSCFRNIY